MEVAILSSRIYPIFELKRGNMPAVAANANAMSTFKGGNEESKPRNSQPLEYSGSLDSYSHNDVTPVIGTEYKGLQVADILKSEQCDQLIKDLAVTSTLHPHILIACF